ncbi:hypothetical protein NEUTE1DRAFT_42242, partial [Neurospora tetrasperma FGSC 2508]
RPGPVGYGGLKVWDSEVEGRDDGAKPRHPGLLSPDEQRTDLTVPDGRMVTHRAVRHGAKGLVGY